MLTFRDDPILFLVSSMYSIVSTIDVQHVQANRHTVTLIELDMAPHRALH